MIDHPIQVRAALAAAGGEAVASHGSAAWLQGIVDKPPAEPHITIPVARRRLSGVAVHRSKSYNVLSYRGVRCTPPARTLADIAVVATPSELSDAVDRALSLGLVRVKDLIAETTKPNGRRRGTDALRRCLDERGDTDVPNPSVLESKMARLLNRYRLPVARPEFVAGTAGEYRIDYAYPDRRIMVELYGYASHHSPEQMASDLARQRQLTLEGWTVLIFTWPDVVHHPEAVARELRRALAGGGR
jgi:very-short-patch-repair endonuclease